MVLLRPRCHYCGKRHVKQKDRNEEQQFKCKHCLAVNFLDENGEIADVPPEEAADPDHILSEIDSPAGSRFESSIFCQTCVKNQLYFNRTLSEYLPDLDDPEYPKYEAALPEFRTKLEDRYPQVCAKCEPKVRQQLQQATYTAKSDHVRRMLAKSRERRIASRLGWRSLVVTLGGLGYWTSIAGQLLWHAMGALSSDRIPTFNGELQPRCCAYTLVINQSSSRECAEYFGHLASHAMKIGILCVWWNPQWQHKLAGLDGRLINLDKYYQSQIAILGLRVAVWVFLQSSLVVEWLPEITNALHGVAFVLLLIVTAWSNYAIIMVDSTPLVDWSQEIGPLLSKQQFVPPQAPPQQFFSPPNSQPSTVQHQTFPVGQLSTTPEQQQSSWKPPSPPLNDPDAMDWEPLGNRFTAQLRKPVVKRVQPSPFHGTLPALNPRGVQHPSLGAKVERREAMGIPPGFFDSGRKPVAQSPFESARSTFAEPSFFPPQDKDSLGLEKIFDDVFKLKDDAAPFQAPPANAQPKEAMPSMFEVPSHIHPQRQTSFPHVPWTLSNTLAASSLPLLAAGLVVWLGEDFGFFCPQQMKLYISILAGSVSLFRLAINRTSLQHSREDLRSAWTFGIFWSLAQVGIFAALSLFRWTYVCDSRGSTGQIDAPLLCGIITQEFYHLMGPNDLHMKAPTSDTGSASSAGTPGHSFPSPTTSEATTIQQTDFGRPRGNSIDSARSSMSTASTTSTAPGWKTPKINARKTPSIGGPSPGFGLGGLMIDDFGTGANIAGPRHRTDRGRGRGR